MNRYMLQLLLDEAQASGDDYTANLCHQALGGDETAERKCALLHSKKPRPEIAEVANTLETFVNRNSIREYRLATEKLGRIHRTLQSEVFKFCLIYISEMAQKTKTGDYDARNEWACFLAQELQNYLKREGKEYFPWPV